LNKFSGKLWIIRGFDDQKNFPGATEDDGVCIGDHVAATIASEAARRIKKLEEIISHEE
jgi:hypothetical protein